MTEADLETTIREIATDVHRRAAGARPSFFEPRDWLRRTIEQSLDDPELRTALFQFVDVLPSLSSSREIGEHLEEYFSRVDHALGGLTLAAHALHAGWIVAPMIRRNVTSLARRFLVENDPDELERVLLELRKEPAGFTLDLVGEATVSEVEALHMLSEYETILTELTPRAARWTEVPQIDRAGARPVPRVDVSVKLSSLYPRFDPLDPDTERVTAERFGRLLREARRLGAGITIDMEHRELKETTFAILRSVLEREEFRDGPDTSIALQAYLPETESDLRKLASWARSRARPVGVRLIKGAYWDTEIAWAKEKAWPVPVFTDKEATDAEYEHLTRILLDERDVLPPAFGTHNLRSLAHAVARARSVGLTPGEYEIQMLHGMAEPLRRALVERGERVRVYVPVGKLLPGMAYLIRRLLENTSNVSFLRQSYVEGEDPSALLARPERKAPAPEPERDPEAFRNEPFLDFSLERVRESFAAALDEVHGYAGRRHRLSIGGHDVDREETLLSRNPANPEEVIGVVPVARETDVRDAVATARDAFHGWSRETLETRTGVLFRTAAEMRRRRQELAAWLVLEVGKGWRDADAEVAEAIDYCEYYGREAERIARGYPTEILPGERNEIVHDPLGVVAVLPPWNFPLAIATGMTVAPLVTGNTVVLKPSEQAPVTGALLHRILLRAGLPPAACSLAQGAGEVGAALVRDDDVRAVVFTGSSRVGIGILEDAGRRIRRRGHVRRVVCEMGGKNVVVIDEDADHDDAVLGTLRSAFGYQGQKCSAAARAIFVGSAWTTVLPRLLDACRTLRIGPPEDPRNEVGPVIGPNAVERVVDAIERARQDGEILLEIPAPKRGWFAPAAVVAGLAPDHPVAREELFGPVLCVFRADSFEEAIELANDTPYGLTGGVFSRSPAHLDHARLEFRVGNLYFNRSITGSIVRRQPFGGIKLSGSGFRPGGSDYLRQFLESRTITENTLRHGFAPNVD